VTPPVIVVGGGWAGLSAAVELSAAGHRVQLLESAPQLGGRARGLDFGIDRVDNGQHLLIGAYRQTLSLMKRIGLDETQGFLRLPMQLSLFSPVAETVALHLPALLPAPLNLLWALCRVRGLGKGARRAALRFALSMWVRRFRLAEDVSVAVLLRRYRQSTQLVERLWAPICLATLNTPVEEASAQLFLTVLHDSFSRRASDAHLLLPRTDLGRLLPEPAAAFVRSRGGEVLTGARVTGLEQQAGRITGVHCGERLYPASQVILATPPGQSAALLASLPELADTRARLEGLESYPVTTVYLRYPDAVHLPLPMVGLLDGPGQWACERHACGQPELVSVVISGPGPHMEMDKAALAAEVGAQLATLFPQLPTPIGRLVVREKRATFRADVGIQQRRPQQETVLAGLWLAGDYTAGPYPATLEGAVRSGVQCARRLLRGPDRRD